MSPVEVVYLSRRCKDISGALLDNYLAKMGSLMSVKEKSYIYLQANGILHRDITAEMILDLLKEV